MSVPLAVVVSFAVGTIFMTRRQETV
jgi:hypothetical protein